MASPLARVKVEFLKITGLPVKVMHSGNTRYARAYFSAAGGPLVSTGRSRPIPNIGGDFDLTSEASPWVFEADAPWGVASISVVILEDHGNVEAPDQDELIFTPISNPPGDVFPNGERKFSRGGGPEVHVRITTTLINPMDSAFLARSTAPAKPSGALAINQGFMVEIVDIPGLYKPDSAPPPAPGSKHVLGYASNDNVGRIFTNRLPDGSWKNDTQFIEVQLKITAFGGVTIPSGAKIEWTIEDPDDPTNEAPEFRREWGPTVDPNDYDAAGTPIGAHPGDNVGAYSKGNTDEKKLFGAAAAGSPAARWAKATGGPAVTGSSRTNAKSAITLVNPKSGKSSVRIHCMNVLGTNLRLRAELTGAPAGVPVFNTATGVMTMWSRIDVEVARMPHARSVSGALPQIPKYFFPACVQLDFQTELELNEHLDKAEMCSSHDFIIFEASARGWVNDPDVFTKKVEPGWFLLLVARLPYKHPTEAVPILSDDSTYKFDGDKLEVSGDAGAAEAVIIAWRDAADVLHNAFFAVNRNTADKPVVAGGKTKMKLWGVDITPHFTGHDSDGSVDHAYDGMVVFYPRAVKRAHAASLTPGGFDIPEVGAKVVVFGAGASLTDGISPGLKDSADNEFFAGRTIVFADTFTDNSHPPKPLSNADFNQGVQRVVVHEFGHAFGMPHKCGQWDWRTPREHSCCMNWGSNWLLDASENMVPETANKMSNEMCARHFMEVRRVHLEKNKGLNWSTL